MVPTVKKTISSQVRYRNQAVLAGFEGGVAVFFFLRTLGSSGRSSSDKCCSPGDGTSSLAKVARDLRARPTGGARWTSSMESRRGESNLGRGANLEGTDQTISSEVSTRVETRPRTQLGTWENRKMLTRFPRS